MSPSFPSDRQPLRFHLIKNLSVAIPMVRKIVLEESRGTEAESLFHTLYYQNQRCQNRKAAGVDAVPALMKVVRNALFVNCFFYNREFTQHDAYAHDEPKESRN